MAGKKKEIEVTVSADGSLTVEGHGYSGGSCEKILKSISNGLGAVESVKKKPEFFQKEKTKGKIAGR